MFGVAGNGCCTYCGRGNDVSSMVVVVVVTVVSTTSSASATRFLFVPKTGGFPPCVVLGSNRTRSNTKNEKPGSPVSVK